ncbi:MAG: hypothetical protein J5I59_08330 [Saprospiraceae bacterium]|nr:hypothetical protein [Saprospiraceae bacterium]
MLLTLNINYTIHAQELDTIDCLSSQFLTLPSTGTTAKPSFSCSLLDLTKGEVDSLPIIKIRVNVHIVNNQSTYPNFYWGAVSDWNELNANKFGPLIIQEMNDIMQTLNDNPIQSSDFIGDSRIRFEIYSDSTNTNDLHNGVWIHSNNPSPTTFEYGDYVLNIIIQSQSSGKCQNGFSPGALTQNYINVYGDPNCILSDSTIGWWSIGRVAIHEFLHSASLCHSFYGAQNCASIDLDAIAECNNGGGTGNCGTIGSCDNWNSGSNNIMGYNVGAQSLTPCQWAQAYETLHMVQPNYITICDFNPNDIVINNGENIV